MILVYPPTPRSVLEGCSLEKIIIQRNLEQTIGISGDIEDLT